jgi:hypothetical protein
MILDLIGWIWDHWTELTFNMILLFILRKFILTELRRLLRFNRTDAAIAEMAQDIKDIKLHMGVANTWKSNSPMNGFRITLPQILKKRYLFSRTAKESHLRRKNMLKSILKANLSKKLISALVSIGVVALNSQFGLGLDENMVFGILGLSAAHITLQTIIDSIKAKGAAQVSTIVQNLPDLENTMYKVIADPNTSYAQMVPVISEVHTALNLFYSDMQSGKVTDATKAAMSVYLTFQAYIKANKPVTPIAPIVVPAVKEDVA